MTILSVMSQNYLFYIKLYLQILSIIYRLLYVCVFRIRKRQNKLLCVW